MSVAPDDWLWLESHRKPRSVGGTGNDPIWEIDEAAIHVERISFRQDVGGHHGVIEPTERMALDVYRAALASTASAWALTDLPDV